ncbi:MAG: bifunctional phosphoglucose/phosphomannose isomerase [Chloroflexi bacterium]|nr:bifunctional phosphoglucose/phosphomannose isomerase [Chloroflexota bacterium]
MVMADLDNLETYETLDRQRMLDRIGELPVLCERAWEMAMNFSLPDHFSQVDRIVVLGMGGSAIGGDLLSTLAISECRVPVLVVRGYTLPAYVNDRTLVIASSYSGNTEETLACFEQSLRADARVLAVTTGGRLRQAAEQQRTPVLLYDYKAQPRAALPFSFLTVLCFMQKLGFVADKSADVRETVGVLRQLSATLDKSVPLVSNHAKQLAQELFGRLAVIYGAGGVSEVAHRWKTQVNENGKAWAFYEVFPELNHNAVVGYQFPGELASRVQVLMLRTPDLPDPVKLRYEITARLLDRAGVAYRVIDGKGSTPLSQMMSLVMVGDYVSYYLALLYRTDPTPVEAIDYLKDQLAHSRIRSNIKNQNAK